MKIILSPAKSLDYQTPALTNTYTQPSFLNDSLELIDQLQTLSPKQVSGLMHISDKLGELNYQRFQDWSLPLTPKTAKQCLFAFTGDVYQGLEAQSMTEQDIEFAQRHLRILSGLYGILKPLDLILPYRLEMGTKFNNNRGNNLYSFWGTQLIEALNAELEQEANPYLINLASNEYSKAVKLKQISAEVITPVFKDEKNGAYKIISFYAKKARGLMSRYIISNGITLAKDIKGFDLGGYTYNPKLTAGNDWVFTRDAR